MGEIPRILKDQLITIYIVYLVIDHLKEIKKVENIPDQEAENNPDLEAEDAPMTVKMIEIEDVAMKKKDEITVQIINFPI